VLAQMGLTLEERNFRTVVHGNIRKE
jgi:hypothetical protein